MDEPTKRVVKWIGAGCVVYVVASLFLGPDPTPESADTDTEPGPEPAGCLEISNNLRADIAGSIEDGRISLARAVRSDVHPNGYYVAARFHVPGVTDVGVWLTNDLEGDGLLYSVDAMAESFSSMGPARGTEANASSGDKGAHQARRCVEWAAETGGS